MKTMLTKKSFTLIELMVTVVILAVITGFALVNYNKSVEQTRLKDAKNQLLLLHAANRMYYAKKGNYWPLDYINFPLEDINENLGLGILENGLTYSCIGRSDSNLYTCTATRSPNGTELFRLTLTEAELDGVNNPSCTSSSGLCP